MNQLYGAFDDATHEWADGVLCTLFRKAAQDESGQWNWVMFDGPVDALWIESMNTVLDENRRLCLVSGEIIQMSKGMTMMFEVRPPPPSPRDALEGGGGTPPSRAPSICPATARLTPSASLNGVCNRQ